jgi:hypothetical protein
MDKAMKLNPKERKELAISEIGLLVLAVIGLGIVGWFAWERPSKTPHDITTYAACVEAGNPVQESYPSVCVTEDGKRFVNPDDTVQTQPNSSSNSQQSTTPNKDQYLTITEWGVRVPLLAAYSDLKYTYTKDDLSERVSFTFKRLEDAGFCKADLGVTMTRNTIENKAPYSLDNPEPIAQVGGYYYYLAYGGSPCYDPDNQDQMKLVNQINGGKLIDAVKQTLAKLQAAS